MEKEEEKQQSGTNERFWPVGEPVRSFDSLVFVMIKNKSPSEQFKGKLMIREKAFTGMAIPKSKIPFVVEPTKNAVQLVVHRKIKSDREFLNAADFLESLKANLGHRSAAEGVAVTPGRSSRRFLPQLREVTPQKKTLKMKVAMLAGIALPALTSM